ncbi:hypothetical protein LguiB_013453 [Lonicera macranthoides]
MKRHAISRNISFCAAVNGSKLNLNFFWTPSSGTFCSSLILDSHNSLSVSPYNDDPVTLRTKGRPAAVDAMPLERVS